MMPTVSAYVWKWERLQSCSTSYEEQEGNYNDIFFEREVPREEFEKINFDAKEPFAVLRAGIQDEYRMQSKMQDQDLPPGCDWFRRDNYQDYLALPIVASGEFKGAMAWSTKNPGGFTDEHIEIFNRSLAALSTVLRVHTNDLVLRTLTGRLEDEVQARTQELKEANLQLEKASQQIAAHAKEQLQHFAMMSHEIRYVAVRLTAYI